MLELELELELGLGLGLGLGSLGQPVSINPGYFYVFVTSLHLTMPKAAKTYFRFSPSVSPSSPSMPSESAMVLPSLAARECTARFGAFAAAVPH